jgi:hypothetical protein
MPYKTERKGILLPRDKDRRVKLTDDDKVDIRKRYELGESIRGIARKYEHKCSRRTIQYVIRPELYKRLCDAFKERRKDGRYKPTKEQWARTMREHRAYKYRTLK